MDIYLYPHNELFKEDKLKQVSEYLKSRYFILQKTAAFCDSSEFFILKDTEKSENRNSYCSIELMKNTIQINFPVKDEDFKLLENLKPISFEKHFFLDTMKFIVETLHPEEWSTSSIPAYVGMVYDFHNKILFTPSRYK